MRSVEIRLMMGCGALPLRSPVARSQRLLQRQRDITRCLGALCVLCVRKEYNVRMVIYISRGARRARKVFIASCAIAGAVVSFATTRVRRGMENGEQVETRNSKRLSTPSPLRGTRPCLRGRVSYKRKTEYFHRASKLSP